MQAKKYQISEIFYSLQGEGIRAGEPSVFVRFAGCNLNCTKWGEGFDCDTVHQLTEALTASEIVQRVADVGGECGWVVLTGGEPTLHIDVPLLQALREEDYALAIETNGTMPLVSEALINWVTVSPKPTHPVVLPYADEVKIVMKVGQCLPYLDIEAEHWLISPAFEGDTLPKENLEYCIQLCLEHPIYSLSVQNHKLWGIR